MDHNAAFSGVPANGGPASNPMPFANGTPPAGDMSAVPPPSTGGSQDAPKTTLWMGELEPWMDEAFIKGVFASAAGETVNVKVIRDKNSGNAGYCFVEFPTPEAANKALGLNGSAVPNSTRQFKLNWASGGGLVDRREDRGPEYSIFVGDLGPEVNEYVLVSLFQSRFPSCKSAKIMTDAMTGQSRGYGFVRFADENDQQRALMEMQGVYCGNRPMRISTATPKNRNNHHAFPGHGHHGNPMMAGGMPQQQMWGGGMGGFPYGGGAAGAGGGFNPSSQMNQFTDPNNTTVFVGGLSGYVTEDELRSFFQGFGEITYVKIPPGKGCGFVQFVHRHAAEMAINQMQGYPIGNSRVRLSWGRSQNNSGVGTPYRPAPPPPHYLGMPAHGPGAPGPYGPPFPGAQGPPGPQGRAP
ncbi:putative RNA-binding protein-like protein [Hapsidospora chrysogenum ATCC 11550]|uniref:Putative RNA-binding protein-like protein n=1 Tax=Hapsidospora chrysogenum (strain ATCC 11550 / CBS 779.69 / DSM 880 / IAM 14645 / JCM 23072 / IMI 49137) TaxID=857340 RepID=A0A086TH00_HAPC1|nr:putative RNA-binding protein-like protein [Hapsidospora chrysogenum ATCC 11550]